MSRFKGFHQSDNVRMLHERQISDLCLNELCFLLCQFRFVDDLYRKLIESLFLHTLIITTRHYPLDTPLQTFLLLSFLGHCSTLQIS